MLDGPAHLELVERRGFQIHPEPHIGEGWLDCDLAALGRCLAEARNGARRDPGIIEIAGFQSELGGLLVLDRNDLDFVELWCLALPVGIARQDEALFRLPFLDEIAPALRRRLGIELAAYRLDRLA